ncbi:MAG: hypothetical protein OEU36_20655 [Gammaproteobacteria bacterium]|nr:hypothetical protein [Gammaproteobacteria bacterium]
MAKEAAEKACACDPASPDAQITLALVNLSNRNHAKALALAERAVSLAPSHAHVSAIASIVFVGCGKLNEAIGLVRKAIQHCPVYPVWYRTTSSRAYWAMLEPEKAESEARLTLELDPRMSYGYVVLAKSLVDQGRIDEAKQAAAAALEIDPDFSIRFWVDGMPYEDPALTDRQVQALLSAGLPD